MKLITASARECLHLPPSVHINDATTIYLFTTRLVPAAVE